MNMYQRLSANFTLGELCASNYATRHEIDNTPMQKHAASLGVLCGAYLQPLREHVGRSIVINSGYRCEELNTRLGGSRTSAHCFGFAADIECPGMSNIELAYRLLTLMDRLGRPFDQLIAEFCRARDPAAGWVHIGIKNRAGDQRGQVLHAIKLNGRTKYRSGLC